MLLDNARHILSNKLVHMSRWIYKAHPIVLTCISLHHTIIPLLIRITRISIAMVPRGLTQTLRLALRSGIDHRAEEVVIDDIIPALGQLRVDGRIGLLDDVAPGDGAAPIAIAQLLCCDGSNMLWVDVGDKHVCHPRVEQGAPTSAAIWLEMLLANHVL